jgi:ABC-2 type transport system ATP-binding protein
VCVIDHGRIAMMGTPDELKSRLLERSITLDAPDRPALLAELRALGLEPAIDEAAGLVRVTYDATTAQSIIARIRTPLSVLRVHDPSLEEAYVELISGNRRDRDDTEDQEAAA